MKYTRGKPLEPGEKWAIVNVKEYFDRNKKEFGLSESSVQLTADALQIGISTIRRVMADYRRDPLQLNKPPKPKGHPNYSIDNSHEEVVRSFIRNANKSGQYITTSTIYDLILEREPKANFHRATLTRMLDRWGFEFGIGARSQHLFDTDETIALRQKYLRRIKANRNSDNSPIRPEIILTESYVNKNHSNDFIWTRRRRWSMDTKTNRKRRAIDYSKRNLITRMD
jgi:transposase